MLASSSLLRITITCRPSTHARCFFDSATMRMRRREERKKETDSTAGVVLIHHRRCGVATVAQPTKHTTQKKESDRLTDKSRREKASPKTTVEESKTPGCQVLCLSIPFIPWGLRTSVSQGLAIHLCDSSTPSAFRRRLRRYVMAW